MVADFVGVNNGATGEVSYDPAPSYRLIDDILRDGHWRVETGRLVDDYAVVSIWVRELEVSGTYADTAALGGRGTFNVCRLLVPRDGTTFRRGSELAYNNTTTVSNSAGTTTAATNRAVVNTGLSVNLYATRIDGQSFRIKGTVEVASASNVSQRALLSVPIDLTLMGGSPVQIAQISGVNASTAATIQELSGGVAMSTAEILVSLE